MEFHDITINDRDWMTDKFRQEDNNGSETIFSNNFLWGSVFGTTAGECRGSLVVCYEYRKKKVMCYPIGGREKKKVIEELREYCHAMGQPLYLTGLYEKDRDELISMFPGQFLFCESRDDEDYIYTYEKLSKLSGKKLHGKRNHIARFMDGDDWLYEKITKENISQCVEMSLQWKSYNSDRWNEKMETEFGVLQKAFEYFDILNLRGGLLRKQGRIVAFSIGEPLNEETFVVHFEKAFSDIQGAYPMINQQFVLNECEGYKFINREEDAGEPGLRKAKLSYCPDILLKKFHAMESDVLLSEGKDFSDAYAEYKLATLHPEINKKDIINVWKTCFGDSEEVISYFIENRMTKENALGIFKDGRLISISCFLEAVYHTENKKVPVRYVYAVATLPEYRERGFAADLIEQGKRLWNEPLILSPAEEGLFSYYERLGFKRRFLGKREIFEAGGGNGENFPDGEGYILEDVSAKEYKILRDNAFLGEGYVEWSEEAVSFALSFYCFTGGHVGKISSENAVILYDIDGEELCVTETTLKGEKRAEVLEALCRQFGLRRAVCVTPGAVMSDYLDASKPAGYLNLILD